MNSLELIQFLSKTIAEKSVEKNIFIVAITGPDASGKSQLAINLNKELKTNNINTLLIQGDWFHYPKKQRESATGNLDEQFLYKMINFDRLKNEVLEPIRQKNNNITFTHHDYDTDKAKVENISIFDPVVILVEGIFILRPSLRNYFDFKIYIHVDPETTLKRALVRDKKRYGNLSTITDKYKNKYLPGQALHRKLHDPMAISNIIVDNNDWEHPKVIKH